MVKNKKLLIVMKKIKNYENFVENVDKQKQIWIIKEIKLTVIINFCEITNKLNFGLIKNIGSNIFLNKFFVQTLLLK